MPGESHGQRSLVVYSPCSCKQPDMSERRTHTFTTFTTAAYLDQCKTSTPNWPSHFHPGPCYLHRPGPEEHARPLLKPRAHLGQDCPANSREHHESQQEDTALARPTVPTSLSMYRAPGSPGSHWNPCQGLPQPRLSWSVHSHRPPLVHVDAIPHPAQVS